MEDSSAVGANGTSWQSAMLGGASCATKERIFDGDASRVAWLWGPMCGCAETGALAVLGRKRRLRVRGHIHTWSLGAGQLLQQCARAAHEALPPSARTRLACGSECARRAYLPQGLWSQLQRPFLAP